jgi:hypothetical protein
VITFRLTDLVALLKDVSSIIILSQNTKLDSPKEIFEV